LAPLITPVALIAPGAANPVGTLIRIISVSVQPAPPSRRRTEARGRTIGLGAALGIATALLAIGIAQLVAAIFNSQVGGPIDAVGEVFIDHTPPWLKNFAIREFGSNDKTVLIWGIRGVLIIFAIIIGILALHRLWQGMLGLALFMAVGIAASESQPTSRASDVLPSLIGGLLAALFLRYVTGLAAEGAAAARWPGVLPARPPGPLTSPDTATGGAAGPAASAEQPGSAGSAADRAEEAVPPQEDGARADTGELPLGPVGPYIPQTDEAGQQVSGTGGRPPVEDWRWQSRSGRPWPQPQPATFGRPVAAGADRRKFLLMSGAAVAGGLVVYGAGSWLANTRDVSDAQRALKLPRAKVPAPPLPSGYDLKIPGLSPFITPNANFYRVDTAIVLPEILPANWQLRIHGMVQRELTLTFDDLIKRPLIEDYITLCCVSNWVGGPYIGNAKWLGASLRSLLREAGIKAGADQLLATSSDGFTSGSPVQVAMDGRDSLLAVAMNDQPLPVEHGFPVRQVIPGLYGYVSACKWIVDIEVTTFAASQAYWVPRGWSPQGPIKTESRIDVPGPGATIKSGTRTAIAGEAWAQHKGIEAVEVRINKGPWQHARLATVPDLDTWRQWVYYWDAAEGPGNYTIEARATDKTGYTQTSLVENAEPNGASGYPSVQVSVS
jgi:DMSO/TMAO reductase YedYZ molybdopterin-dependent catalytic subunit